MEGVEGGEDGVVDVVTCDPGSSSLLALRREACAVMGFDTEGMDVPALNTVILASPKSDVQQSVGRILRRTDHPVVPTVVDIVDGLLSPKLAEFALVAALASPALAEKMRKPLEQKLRAVQKRCSPPPLLHTSSAFSTQEKQAISDRLI